MLTELQIRDFAIIDQLGLHFKPGLVVFTGETGAGKSIILDAIETLLGGRADSTLIRAGTDRASVEASFSINNMGLLRQTLAAEDLDEGDELTFERSIRQEGKNTARINGHHVTLAVLEQIGGELVDIHGQSEHLSLLNTRRHLDLLDRFAGLDEALAAYQSVYTQLQQVRRSLKELHQAEREAAQRIELLRFQLQEISAAKLQPGEEDELQQERTRLANAEGLASLAQGILLKLDEGAPDSPSVNDLLGEVNRDISSLVRLDPSQQTLMDSADTMLDYLSDIVNVLRRYQDGIEFNPRRLEQVEDRLDLIHNLKRKYGGSVEAVLAYEADSQRKLDDIENVDERIAELAQKEAVLLVSAAEMAASLSEKRKKAAEMLSKQMENELGDLKMPGARFSVDFQTRPDANGLSVGKEKVAFDATGSDRVEFLIAPNPGEGLKPLAKIASGGETSRLMLALKTVLVNADSVPTLIFDEIDQGIGGRVGLTVGHKLWKLARNHQVFCVTHLPQLAAFGDQHYHVAKQVDGGRTTTRVTELKDEPRRRELAQMLGEITDGTLQSAQEIMQMAAEMSKK
jgi:DNA repair protein RecN (Recombination protein N)